MAQTDLTDRLKAEARRLGFDDVGIAPAVTPPGYPDFLRWLASGHQAGMGYMERRGPERVHPRSILDGVRSVVIVSVVYGRAESPSTPMPPTAGKIARYARGGDYHDVLRRKLAELLAWLRSESPGARGRGVVDTAPLLERDFAQLAGLGWIGKNTMLISRRLGSFTFLAALLVDIELNYDEPHRVNHCGSCTRCLDACPTEAFVGPYELDSRRCISYWTIEHRGMIPDEPARLLDGWVFGCDICQEVCPWNRKAPVPRLPEFEPRAEWTDPNLLEWLERSEMQWNSVLRDAAPQRSRRAGLLRNSALVLGSRRLPEAVEPLAARLDDPAEDPLVRAASAWALGQIGCDQAVACLQRHEQDPDTLVRDAVQRAGETAKSSSR
jgi:epoxyqueuosine reductase